jgi:hypothetical protein
MSGNLEAIVKYDTATTPFVVSLARGGDEEDAGNEAAMCGRGTLY